MPTRPVFLRSLRERRGFTQAQLAQKSGIAQAHISKLETKRRVRSPMFEIVVALAEALAVDPRRLRFGPDPTPIRRRLRGARALPPVVPEASA